jgi:hypothetical protein
MATKKTGNPPGGSRKPAKPRRDRAGRPKVALRNHHERLLRALQVVLIGFGIDARKAVQTIELFSGFPEVDVEVSFKARFPATDNMVPVSFDLSRLARGEAGRPLLERLRSRVDYAQRAMRDLSDDDRNWLLNTAAAILLNMPGGTLDARQKRAATDFLLGRIGGERKAIKPKP